MHLDSIPTSPQGKEVVMTIQSLDIDNKKTFYTDSNGLEMQERKLNYRPTWDLKTKSNLDIPANYFPVNSAIAIKDESKQMTVINDRP